MLKIFLFVVFAAICLATCSRCGSDDVSYSKIDSDSNLSASSLTDTELSYPEPETTEPVVSDSPEVAELKSYLATKGLELCSIYNIIGAMERRNGQIADAKFPENAISRSLYQESLNEKDRAMLNEKYGFEETTISEINWYGIKACR